MRPRHFGNQLWLETGRCEGVAESLEVGDQKESGLGGPVASVLPHDCMQDDAKARSLIKTCLTDGNPNYGSRPSERLERGQRKNSGSPCMPTADPLLVHDDNSVRIGNSEDRAFNFHELAICRACERFVDASILGCV
jgi:hypothetical protein